MVRGGRGKLSQGWSRPPSLLLLQAHSPAVRARRIIIAAIGSSIIICLIRYLAWKRPLQRAEALGQERAQSALDVQQVRVCAARTTGFTLTLHAAMEVFLFRVKGASTQQVALLTMGSTRHVHAFGLAPRTAVKWFTRCTRR